jgi:integrase
MGRLPQASHAPESSKRSHHKPSERTIEQAIQDYLEDQRSHHRRPKTLEWHKIALGLFQHYLLTEHQCILLRQITEAEVDGWLAALPQMPTATGTLRSPNTVESYARSARAFCQWLVRHRSLPATPFAHLLLPQMQNRLLRPLEPEEWEQLLLACHPPKETGKLADQATARNRAILWVLFDTGMRASEVCALRLVDVDREQGILRVRGKGADVDPAWWLFRNNETSCAVGAPLRMTLANQGQKILLVCASHVLIKCPLFEIRAKRVALRRHRGGWALRNASGLRERGKKRRLHNH